MLRINKQTDYAVRVVLSLSKREMGKRVSTSEIGREMLIPRALLQRIVAELANGKLINTQAGRDGGIELARHPKEITFLQVVEHFEGELHLSDCVLNPSECALEKKCPVHCHWIRLRNLLREEMSRVTFQQLAEESRASEAEIKSSALIHPFGLTANLSSMDTGIAS